MVLFSKTILNNTLPVCKIYVHKSIKNTVNNKNLKAEIWKVKKIEKEIHLGNFKSPPKQMAYDKYHSLDNVDPHLKIVNIETGKLGVGNHSEECVVLVGVILVFSMFVCFFNVVFWILILFLKRPCKLYFKFVCVTFVCM